MLVSTSADLRLCPSCCISATLRICCQSQMQLQDGQPCKNTVNKSICAFCDYHVQGEYRKLRSARGGFSDSMLQTGIRSSQTGGAHLTPARPDALLPSARPENSPHMFEGTSLMHAHCPDSLPLGDAEVEVR